MKRFLLVLRRIFSFCFGQMLVLFGQYKKTYLTGCHFVGNQAGPFAVGWEWVVNDWKGCRILRKNLNVPWPVSPLSTVVNPQNIHFHPDDLNNFQTFGCYFQGDAEITIGRGTYIAPNVGIITGNHDLYHPADRREPKPVTIGSECWIGMNAVILPGVTLGDHTVVAAGAVVTKSFTEGFCVIGGVPATKIKDLSINSMENNHEE